jgi:YidC/Oxa1 family membrane protein insertase
MKALQDVFSKLLGAIFNISGNFTLSIIILTFLVKVILLPLTLKQDKSMRKMKEIQPDVDKIRNQFPNKQEQNIKIAELYKERKINPAAGCLPILLQMPILFALFAVFRDPNNIPVGSQFLFWDLTQKDPYFVFPVLNGALTFLQQKLTPQQGGEENPMAKNMLIMMPIMIIFMSVQLPMGLQVYWVTSSALSIVQQQLIMRLGDRANAK